MLLNASKLYSAPRYACCAACHGCHGCAAVTRRTSPPLTRMSGSRPSTFVNAWCPTTCCCRHMKLRLRVEAGVSSRTRRYKRGSLRTHLLAPATSSVAPITRPNSVEREYAPWLASCMMDTPISAFIAPSSAAHSSDACEAAEKESGQVKERHRRAAAARTAKLLGKAKKAPNQKATRPARMQALLTNIAGCVRGSNCGCVQRGERRHEQHRVSAVRSRACTRAHAPAHP